MIEAFSGLALIGLSDTDNELMIKSGSQSGISFQPGRTFAQSHNRLGSATHQPRLGGMQLSKCAGRESNAAAADSYTNRTCSVGICPVGARHRCLATGCFRLEWSSPAAFEALKLASKTSDVKRATWRGKRH